MSEPRFMTVIRAAETLGCHPETLRRAIRNGRLSCYRFGGCTRISPEHLQAYLETALCPARDPKDHGLRYTAGDGPSSGGKTDPVAEFRLGQRMNAALDSPLRISRRG